MSNRLPPDASLKFVSYRSWENKNREKNESGLYLAFGRFGISIDLTLFFLVTPDFHRLHHRSDRRYTDSNYGSMLPWFDYLFGTASDCDFQDQRKMTLGLEYAREPQDSRLDRMIFQLPSPEISPRG
jgi:hypothetical protein